jgi:hypothetical protein
MSTPLAIGAIAALAAAAELSRRQGRSLVVGDPVHGKAVKQWVQTPESYQILDAHPETYGSTWSAGGCLVLAVALQGLIPSIQLVGVAGHRGIEHVCLQVGRDHYIDADGMVTQGELLQTWRQREGVKEARLVLDRDLRGGVLAGAQARGIPFSPKAVAQASGSLRRFLQDMMGGGAASNSRKGSPAMAPGYRSWKWTKQDWRSIVPKGSKLDWSKKCGAKGTRTKDGRPALCLPIAVIERLNGSESGRQILRGQAMKKWKAKKGARIPWHPRIKALHRELEDSMPEDNPRLKGSRSWNMPTQEEAYDRLMSNTLRHPHFRLWLDEYLEGDPQPDTDDLVWYAEEYLSSEHGITASPESWTTIDKLSDVEEELLRDVPFELYHGTSTVPFQNILKQKRMRAARSQEQVSDTAYSSRSGFYLGSDYGHIRKWYANQAARTHGGFAMVLTVLVFVDELTPDPDDAHLTGGVRQWIVPELSTDRLVDVWPEWAADGRVR